MSGSEASRVPLSGLADLMAAGEPLPFKVMDSQGRLLLAAGQRVLDARQMAALLEREACADATGVAGVEKHQRCGAAQTTPAATRQAGRCEVIVGQLKPGIVRVVRAEVAVACEVEKLGFARAELVLDVESRA